LIKNHSLKLKTETSQLIK